MEAELPKLAPVNPAFSSGALLRPLPADAGELRARPSFVQDLAHRWRQGLDSKQAVAPRWRRQELDFEPEVDRDDLTAWESYEAAEWFGFGLPSEAYGAKAVDVYDPVLKAHFSFDIPQLWVNLFNEGSYIMKDFGWGEDVLTARLSSDPPYEVRIKVADADSFVAQRETRMMSRIRTAFAGTGIEGKNSGKRARSGHVLNHFDHETLTDAIYLMTQSYDSDLQAWLDAEEESGGMVALEISLPLLIDILRGLAALEEVDMVHAAVTPANIALTETESGTWRGLISGIGGVCSKDVVNGSLRRPCKEMIDGTEDFFVTSPFYQPPQVRNGSPTGFADHVWSAGMIFAQMCVGYNPVEIALAWKSEASVSVFSVEGRKFVRRFIMESFAIEQDPVFVLLDNDVQHLLSGMLAKDAKKRFSTSVALDEAKLLAKARGIEVPSPLRPAELPAHSWGFWYF